MAQDHPSLINGDPLSCFSLSGTSYASLAIMDVTGQPFAKAWHIKTATPAPNAWDIRIRCFQTNAAQAGDTVLASFWMRTTNSGSGNGFASLVLEENQSPYAKSLSYTVAAGPEWKKFDVPFTMNGLTSAASYAANGYNLSFWVNFDPQEIEIGGLTITDYGPDYPYANLPTTNWPYDGIAADAPWRAEAARRIDKYRKADLAVVVHDDAGNPIAGAPVHVQMKKHAFGFGSAVAGERLLENSVDAQQYRDAIPKLFNKAVPENNLKWPFWETWGKQGAQYALETYFPANGISMVRGHNLIWPDLGNLPEDAANMVRNGQSDALRKRIADHFTEEAGYARGKLTEWDVLNEPCTSKDVQALLGNEEMATWFQKAREIDPDAKLYLNDFSILASGGYDLSHQNCTYDTVKFILDHGGPIDGIGLQSHFDSNLTAPTRVWEVLDRFAQLGKDLQVTEFDINIGDEKVQADYTRDFLTATFAHPKIVGFMMWGFWAGQHWLPQGAMIRQDWTTKPNYDVWNQLVYKDWWTDVQGATGADGVFRVRGFQGDYDVAITANGQTRTVPLTVAPAAGNYVTQGAMNAGIVLAVVNAASFASGPVAPGETVTVFGTGFGAPTIAYGSYDADGQLATRVADTRVLFDGRESPMVYSLWGQVTAVVPYGVSGTTQVQVEYQGATTDPFAVQVAPAAPGLYTRDASGKHQAVAVNVAADGSTSFNSPIERAQKGQFVTLFLTGEGQTNPAGADGKLPAYPNNPAPVQPLVVSFDGVESTTSDNWVGVVYAGVLQVNVRVPADAPSGDAVPVVVRLGGTRSPDGPTIAIQ